MADITQSQQLAQLHQSIQELKQMLQHTLTQLSAPSNYETQPELCHIADSYAPKNTTIRCPEDAFALLQDMGKLEQEELRLLLLNTKNRVLAVQTVFRGTIDSSLVSARDIFRNALRKNAVRVLIAHNHPSGEISASGEDIRATLSLVLAGQCIGIPLLDHLIIGGKRFLSMKEGGLLDANSQSPSDRSEPYR